MRFCQLGGWIESTSADIVLTGSVVSISRRQLWSEWNETAVYLSQGPIMCVCYSARCVCFCVYSLEHVCETYINAQDVYLKVLFVFFLCVLRFKLVRRFLQHEARSPPRPPYGHLETLICAVYACVVCVCVCVCEQLLSVFVCLAGHEQCADDVKSPWVAFRRSPARSGNHPVYGPYVKTAQKRAHSSSEDLTHSHIHSS